MCIHGGSRDDQPATASTPGGPRSDLPLPSQVQRCEPGSAVHDSQSQILHVEPRRASSTGLPARPHGVTGRLTSAWARSLVIAHNAAKTADRSADATSGPPMRPAPVKNRRRPTLPGPLGPSTIGAEGLNCSVRNGKRCFPLAKATGKSRETAPPGPSKLHSATGHQKIPSSPRPISTGLLRTSPSFQIRPINLVVYQGSYSLKGMGELILRSASRLDAFSGYPIHT
jgi:hypothetical protein